MTVPFYFYVENWVITEARQKESTVCLQKHTLDFRGLLISVRVPDFNKLLNGSKQLGKKLVILAEGS